MAIANKAYEVKIIGSKKDPKHDLTQPWTAKAPTNGQPAGRYFICELLAQKKLNEFGVMARPQKRRIPLVIFDSSDQQVLFNDILESISKEANYTKGETGLAIHPSEFAIIGKVLSRPAGGVYQVIGADGVPLKKGNTEEIATRSEIRVFIHEEEDEEVRFAQELARIPANAWVKANANDDDIEE